MNRGHHFFSIILEETLQRNKLQIPKKIVRKCEGTLTNRVVLKLPCGSQWKLGLTKSSDGKVWIDKGWPEFSKQYSIARGHLLVFRYEGNSQFSVVIFDTTTTEIDYPNSNLNHFEKHIGIDGREVKEEPKDDDPVEHLGSHLRPCPKTRSKSPLPCSRPHKRRRTSSTNGDTRSHHDHRPEVNCDFHQHKEGVSEEKSIPARAWRLNEKEKAQALKRCGFKSEDPFFMVVMQRSNLQNKCALILPHCFAKKHLSTSMDVILKAADKRTWRVKHSYREYNYRTPRARFELGWKAFVSGNDLKLGDICIFVLSRNTRPVSFEISIYRDNGVADSRLLPAKASGTLPSKVESGHTTKSTKTGTLSTPLSTLLERRAMAFERANRFHSDNPFFTVVMQPSYTTAKNITSLRIPSKFARTYIAKNGISDIGLWVSDGKSWPVQYKDNPKRDRSTDGRFCHGWPSFVRDNGLEEGDICTFELINNGNSMSFKVSIVKFSHEAHDYNIRLDGEKTTELVKPKRNCSGHSKTVLVSESPNIIKNENKEDAIVEPEGKFSKAYEAASEFA